MSNNIELVEQRLRECIDTKPERVSLFFKTGAGHYSEHDKFLGISVPVLRKIAKEFILLSSDDLLLLLQSGINEKRLLALIILVDQYIKASEENKEELYQFYMQNLKYVNNWNLVDSSAHLITGAHLWDKDRQPLITLSESEILWERRIAIVSTWHFIRKKDLVWTFKLAELLLNDKQDLMHKAVGWMLREAGKCDITQLIQFLDEHAKLMPRTMLRYAIEKFPEDERKRYLLKSKDRS